VPEDAAALAAHSLQPGESVLLRDPAGRHPDVWVSPTDDDERGRGLIHLDLQLDDLSELAHLVEVGAQIRWEVGGERPWTVFAAPDGVLFCAKHPQPKA